MATHSEDDVIPDDEHLERRGPNAPVFAVAPVTARHRIPRGVLAALVVGVVAFVGGLAVASSGSAVAAPDGSARPQAAVVASEAPPPSPTPRPTERPSLPPPGSSAFFESFRPEAVVTAVEGGARCTTGDPLQKEVPRTRADGPRLTVQRSWMVWCPVPEDRRQAFLLDVLERLVDAVPADTFGYSASGTGAGDALFPYAERPLAGTVALTAGAAGDGYAIAIVVEEWRLDQDR